MLIFLRYFLKLPLKAKTIANGKVSEFKRILDQEYQYLADRTLDQLGIRLKDTASDQTVIIKY